MNGRHLYTTVETNDTARTQTENVIRLFISAGPRNFPRNANANESAAKAVHAIEIVKQMKPGIVSLIEYIFLSLWLSVGQIRTIIIDYICKAVLGVLL